MKTVARSKNFQKMVELAYRHAETRFDGEDLAWEAERLCDAFKDIAVSGAKVGELWDSFDQLFLAPKGTFVLDVCACLWLKAPSATRNGSCGWVRFWKGQVMDEKGKGIGITEDYIALGGGGPLLYGPVLDLGSELNVQWVFIKGISDVER